MKHIGKVLIIIICFGFGGYIGNPWKYESVEYYMEVEPSIESTEPFEQAPTGEVKEYKPPDYETEYKKSQDRSKNKTFGKGYSKPFEESKDKVEPQYTPAPDNQIVGADEPEPVYEAYDLNFMDKIKDFDYQMALISGIFGGIMTAVWNFIKKLFGIILGWIRKKKGSDNHSPSN